MSSDAFLLQVERGRRLFEAGRFFDAHEAWEQGWRRAERGEKRLLQVLVLWAAGCHHAQSGNELGARRLLMRAMERLAALELPQAPFDLDPLRDALVETWALLRRQQPLTVQWTPAPRRADAPLELTHRARCPYCGEPVQLEVEPERAEDARYVEDCPVCCRPWDVRVTRGAVQLLRDDE